MRLLIGFSPGSASYNVAQMIVPRLSVHLGRKVELEQYPGDSGKFAARMVAAARPDDNTLLVATLGTHALVPALDDNCGYDPVSDFTPISLMLKAPLILAVPATAGAGSLGSFIERARQATPPLTYGSSAIGGAPYLAAELFGRQAGVPFRHVRYADTRELYGDLMDGRIDLSFNNVMSMLPLIEEGRLVPLGTTGSRPHPALPNVAPISGTVSDYEVTNWLGIVGPAGMPPAAVAEINAAVAAAVHDVSQGDAVSDFVASSAEDFAAFIGSECRRWASAAAHLR